ncbi:MAG: DoxX family protein [Bacteroidales bacterium]|nr:DoxX family protein [Bacteroidales bacterium]MCF8398501.1 DoxX family protein [Bacteroidales bacterium]
MKLLRVVSRWLVGIVFMFSGIVKGVDPLGTAYRIEDYFVAYGMEWAIPLALFLSVSLSALEFVLGFALVFNTRLKFLSWILFLLMIFFTGLTFYDALYNPVPDCGCFGDAIKLTNWETFYKNLVLIVFVSIIFFTRKKEASPWASSTQMVLILLAAGGFVWFSVYNLNHLPVLDFRSWEVGQSVKNEHTEEPDVYLTYRNINTGETKEYLSPNYPWNDSVWLENWEFVSQRFEEKGENTAELKIENRDGEDFTRDFIKNPYYQFLVVAYDLDKTDTTSFKKLNGLYQDVEREGHDMIALTSSIPAKVDKFREKHNVEYDFYYADDIILKTIIRSNPGLILLKDGIVLDKWHYNDFPEYGDIFAEHIEH